MRNIYQDAIDAQCACNLSGLVHSLSRAMEQIWEEARANNGGSDYVNRHPVVIMYLAQMTFLSTGGIIDIDAHNKAYGICEQKAGQAA